MIKYRLSCAKGHEFETWFRNSGDYDSQVKRRHVACPSCGCEKVRKAIMAPAVSSSTRSGGEAGGAAATSTDPRIGPAIAAMRAMRDELTRDSEHVGRRFAEEARRIHYKEAPDRSIHGEASSEEARALSDEGIPLLPLPRLPEDSN